MQGTGGVEAKAIRAAAAAGAGVRAAGFTYIGVLVLVAIMGMALALASELWHTAQKREKEQELLFIGSQFRRAIAMHSANGGGNLQQLEDLLRDPRFPGVRRYLRRIYRDPMTGSTEWGLVKSGGNVITGVYSLSGDEPLKQAGFASADRDFEGKKKYSDWVFAPKPVPGTSSAIAPAQGAAGTPAPTQAIPAAGSIAQAPAGTAAPAQATPGATAPVQGTAGKTQSDTTTNRSQARVRR